MSVLLFIKIRCSSLQSLSKLHYIRSLRHFWRFCQFFLAILLIFVLYILILCHWMPTGLLYFLLKYIFHHYEVITLTLNNAFALKFIFSKNIIDFNWYFFNTCLKCIYVAFFDFQCFFVLIIGMFLLITYTSTIKPDYQIFHLFHPLLYSPDICILDLFFPPRFLTCPSGEIRRGTILFVLYGYISNNFFRFYLLISSAIHFKEWLLYYTEHFSVFELEMIL